MNTQKIKVLVIILKALWKISVTIAGVTAFTNPVSAIISGVSVLGSVSSSVVKDTKFKKTMRMVNLLACNLDRASNDKKINS